MMSHYKRKEYSKAIHTGDLVLVVQPNNLEALYIVGLSGSMLDNHTLCISCFEKIRRLDPKYKKNLFLFLSISYKKINNPEKSVNTLN
jgi:tetratricopeptide (TPR) repeat protein